MKIAIIGAGFGGMAAAYDLRNAGQDVTIFESADYLIRGEADLAFPALAKAKEKARRTSCQSGLRQLGLALIMYGGDNQDRVPTGIRDDGGEHTIWIGTNTFNAIVQYSGTNMSTCPSVAGTFQYYQAPYGWVIGYSYNGGHKTPWSGTPNPKWVSPQKFTENPLLVLACDLNQWSPADLWAPTGQ